MNIISVTRTIDDMGRIVFPVDVRKALNLEDYLVMRIDNKSHLIKFGSTGRGKKVPLDESGRLALPPEYLKKLEWETGTVVGLYLQGEEGVLQGSAPSCVICGSNQALLSVKKTLVCEDCIKTGTKAVFEKWSIVLDKLFKKYKGYCEAAITSAGSENVHKARTKGRRLRTLLRFIGMKKEHPLNKRLKEAHDFLGEVREDDVFIEAFEKEAETGQYMDVYKNFAQEAIVEREKHRKKLQQQLPKIIDDEFILLWEAFLRDELEDYIIRLDTETAASQYEEDFNERVKEYKGIKDKKSDKGLNALHSVRKKAKKLRYIYSFLDLIETKDYSKKAKHYKKFQKEYGDIIDLRDWLNETNRLSEQVDVNENEFPKIRKQLNQNLKKLVKQVRL
ncbi:CHAD domain-containing protein [Bacillus sp. P14.5]|uniref:CHAD domain-containing protein n=1 Tax=Bacillus sp. P14.5 TaxID=1983400 RepID=UPI000DEBAA87|nr:CHAD domain-containing protein [Bacillus sp. P14.5]